MNGPFVYRLGRKIFILERGVRFSYGLPSHRAEFHRTPLFLCPGWGRHRIQKSDLKDLKDPKDSKDLKDIKDPKDLKDVNDSKDYKELKNFKEIRASKVSGAKKLGILPRELPRELRRIGEVGLRIFLGFLNFAADFECKGIHFWFSTI